MPGGTDPTEGETRYTYDAANRLIKVELYTGGGYLTLSEATYNGDGDRVSLTTYALGNAQTTTYFTVKGEVLVTSNDQANQYQLFGQGLVGQYQEGQWHYFLHDGQASVRTIVDETGEVINQQDYRPFGGPLSSDGQYESQFGFLGAQVDRLSGLLYVGGRYYDPVTGRFLTPAHSGTNPYSPLPVMWLLLPGLGLLLWRGRRDGSWRVLVLVCVFGFYITGCQGEPVSTPIVGVTPPQMPTHTGTPTETVTNTPTATNTPTGTPTNTATWPPTHTPTHTPTGTNTPIPSTPNPPTPYPPDECPAEGRIEWLPELFTITYYSVALEWDPIFAGSQQVKIPTLNDEFLFGGRTVPDKFLYDYSDGLPNRGTGRLTTGEYIKTEWWQSNGTKFVEGKGAKIIEWRTVAVDPEVVKGSKIVIESIKNGAAVTVTDSQGVFEVTDTGGGVDGNEIDIYVGEKTRNEIYAISAATPNVSKTRVGIIR